MQMGWAHCSRNMWITAASNAVRSIEHRISFPSAASADGVIESIVLAAMSMECFINELVIHLDLDQLTGCNPRPTELVNTASLVSMLEKNNARALSKYRAASIVLGGNVLCDGSEPLQSAQQLNDLRNELVHLKPKATNNPGKAHGAVVDLFNRGYCINKPGDKDVLAGWYFQIQSPQVAKWACRSAFNLIWHIAEQLEKVARPHHCAWIFTDHVRFGWQSHKQHFIDLWR
ncbi:MAG: hypothetical protein R3B58_14705 [Phycisphaerales bacterium]